MEWHWRVLEDGKNSFLCYLLKELKGCMGSGLPFSIWTCQCSAVLTSAVRCQTCLKLENLPQETWGFLLEKWFHSSWNNPTRKKDSWEKTFPTPDTKQKPGSRGDGYVLNRRRVGGHPQTETQSASNFSLQFSLLMACVQFTLGLWRPWEHLRLGEKEFLTLFYSWVHNNSDSQSGLWIYKKCSPWTLQRKIKTVSELRTKCPCLESFAGDSEVFPINNNFIY